MSKTGVLAGAIILLTAALTAGDQEEVILKSRRFVPEAGLDSVLRQQLPTMPERVHVLVQLEDVPTSEWRADALAAGLKLLAYVPHRAWLASLPADRADRIARLDGVRAVCAIQPQDKLAPSLREVGVNSYSTTASGQAYLTATFFPDVALETGVMRIEGLGGRVLARDDEGSTVVFHLPLGAIYTLAAWDGLLWIDQHYPAVDMNDGARSAIGVDPVQTIPYDLTGAGVIVGQWEGGGHPDANHPDLVGRVISIDDGRPVSAHATLMAGTMIGDGSTLGSRLYRGMAPAATLVSYYGWDSASDLRGQYRQAINLYDIDIANNSWGKVEWDIYKDYAGAMDDIVRGSLGKRISIVWSVGNKDGWGTIFCTAVGKNIVAVGATNSDDNSLWHLSGQGPTEDGRIKPDLVAPGSEADDTGWIWSTLPLPSFYGGARGTSPAAAVVSGTMALVLEQWRVAHQYDPLPSTIKGILIHTATDLGPAGPDYAYGHGLVNAKKAIDLLRADPNDRLIVEEVISVHGERDSYEFEVKPGRSELRITLVWDDYPALPLAARALVNDLDLVVTDPSGTQHYPWTLMPATPEKQAERTRRDNTNNVEQVCIEDPAPGTWLITIWGSVVPHRSQHYSLLTDEGRLTALPPGTPVLSVTGYLGNTVAEFDDAGNLILQGRLTTYADCQPFASSFVVWAPDKTAVAHIDPSGNMRIRGALNELSHCTLPDGGFPVTDWLGNTVASIDAAGNLCLAGRLCQND